ncbi:hypothetical protein QQG55_15565 [Brugia pahangi]
MTLSGIVEKIVTNDRKEGKRFLRKKRKERMSKKLHIKALSLKINSLEAEKALLITRNDELESRLIQLGQNLSIASVIASSATITPCTVESVSNLVSSGSAFKPVHTQTMMQVRLNNGRQSAAEALRWPVLENVAAAYGHQYNENLVNNMQIELDIAREECSLVQEKIVKMGCINSELEHQLINVKEGLEKAEMRARQAEEQVGEFCRNCSQQEEYQKSLQSEFLVKYSAIEREVNDLKEELALRNEQLNARMIENNKRNEEMKQWRFAMDEMETVHMEIKMLEKQLNDEKASMESKWAEVRTILLERKGDISRKTSDAESIADGEQSSINQLKQMVDTINDLKNTVDKQAKQLERNKTEKQKFKAVIRQLQADKKALVASSAMKNDEEQYLVHEAQITGLQKQLDFMDREMTLLFTLNNSKDVLIQTLRAELEGIYSTEPKLSDLRPKNDRKEDDCIEHLQAQVKNTNQEESGRLNLLTKSNAELQRLQVHTQQLQVGYDRLQLQLQLSPEGNLDAMSSNRGTYQRAQLQQAQQQMEFNSNEVVDLSMAAKLAHGEANKDIEMRTQMERLTEAVQQKDTELQKMLNENEALKIKCIESTAALDLLSSKLERRSQEKDAIIEMLQSQHTYLTQTILLNQKSEEQLTTPLTLSQSIKTDTELKCIMQDASTIMEEAESRPFLFMQHRETQTRSDFHFSETPETSHESTSRVGVLNASRIVFWFEKLSNLKVDILHNLQTLTLYQSRKVIHDNDPILENEKIFQCIEKSDQIRDNLTDDIRQLMILNAELETAVEVLKGEIWTLNEQLKRSLIDREDLSEKLCKLSQRHEEEIERARERERDLEEQKDVAERSQRQAALAENESNRRLVEWQEKSAQMENSRIELENAYAKLSEYYQQLQHAYNALYARSNACKVDSNTQTTVDSNTFKISEKFAETIKYWKSELKQREAELKGQAVQLKHVQDLLRNHLHIILKNVRDLREMSLKLIKNIIMESVQTTRAQLHEALKEVLSYVEEVIVKLCKEKELKDAEITVALQHLMNDTLTENILQTRNSSLSMVVDAINKKFTEMKSENTTLGNDLWNERSDKEALEMNAQQSISEKNGLESKIKELEDLLQITQFSLAEHVIKCQQLQAELDVLGSATSSPTAVKCGSSSSDPWNCSTPCTICRELRQTEQSAPTPQLQLAILAARLTTKIADNDALFRCNAELTQTNLRLQNEVSELKEQMTKHITSSSNTLISAISQQSLLQQQYIPKQFSNQSSEQKVMHREEKEWTWEAEDLGAELVSNSGYQVTPYKPLLNQQITKLTMTNEIQVLGLTELTSQEEDKESLKKEFNVTREYSVEVEERNKAGRLGNCSEITEDYCLEYENKVEQLKDCGIETEQHGDARHQQKLEVSGTNTIDELLSLKSYNVQLAGFVESEKQELKELGKGLQDTGTRLGNEGIQCELFWAGFTEGLEEQKEVAKGKLKENEHEAKEKDWISGGTPEQQFQTLLFKQDIPPDGVVEGNRIQMLQKLEQHQGREIEMQELENRSLNLQLRSQQQVIEELGKKLNVAQEYNVVLEEKTLSMEQKIIDLKKMYEELLVEKGRLAEEVKNEIKTKLHEEITLLKKENESLVVELAKKRASHNEEKRSMKAELANREIILKELKTEMEHTQGESVDMQRQLDSYNAQMENESNQDLHQQLVEAQRKVVELESRLNEVVEQNRLLKNSEQKLMDALMVSNKSGPNLQTSLLKKAKITKNRGRVRKPMMHDGNTMVEVHGKVGTSSTTMQLLDNPVITNDYLPVQKKVDDPKGKFDETLHGNALLEEAAQEMQSEISTLIKPFEPTLQRTTHYFHEMNVDKLRRRKGGGFQGAEKT